MIDVTVPESVSISALNALEYCPRRFYYQFVQGESVANDYVLEGTLDHQRVHREGVRTSAEGEIQTTRLYLFSETLRLSGFADVVEEREGQLIPVEYKHGKQGQWLNDAVQLCAQAMCLEERRSDTAPIPYGYIFYVSSRRRVQVQFTEELRERTRASIAQAFQVAAFAAPPPPLTGKLTARCPHCSLLPLCLPDEVNTLQSNIVR
ncbi:MAG: CRISPR-associated protein Cas4 [Ktedonobacteraceae bacterium]